MVKSEKQKGESKKRKGGIFIDKRIEKGYNVTYETRIF